MSMHIPRRAALLLPMPALAQGWAPDRAVRIIVPFAPGGPTDILARLVQGALAEGLGQSVIIENRPGAGGNIGFQLVQRSAPDGLTLLFTSSAFAANPALTRPTPYDALRDFAPISNVAASPNAIVAAPRAGITTLAEMLARARAQPGSLEYSSPGNGTGPHITAELFRLRASINMLHVPFNGGAPAVQAALAGTVALAFSAMPAAAPHIRSGALRGLAVTGAQRWPDFPDLPTVQELGFPGFVAETWQALLAPAGTPAAVLNRVSAITREYIAGLPVERLRGIGFTAVGSTPEQFAAQLAREVPELAAGIAAANIRAD